MSSEDVYVGYDSGNLPDNNDFVPGTMSRAWRDHWEAQVVGGAPTASLGLKGTSLGIGPGNVCGSAVNLAQLNAARAGAIASAVTQSSDFDQLKDNLLSILAP